MPLADMRASTRPHLEAPLRRVLVIGSGGAGKTTLAARIAEATGLPLVHLDALYWHPGWVPTAPDAWRAVVAELVARPAWVMDGNYGGTLNARLAAADTIVFLDWPRIGCLWRVVKRRLRYRGRRRPSMAPGCPERLSLDFLRWIWEYPARRRPGILARIHALEGGKRVEVLRNRADVEAFVAGLGRSVGGGPR